MFPRISIFFLYVRPLGGGNEQAGGGKSRMSQFFPSEEIDPAIINHQHMANMLALGEGDCVYFYIFFYLCVSLIDR